MDHAKLTRSQPDKGIMGLVFHSGAKGRINQWFVRHEPWRERRSKGLAEDPYDLVGFPDNAAGYTTFYFFRFRC